MAWNNPTNTSVLQVWTSAKVNEAYDNLRYLKGQAGTVQIENNVNFGAASPGASTRLGVGANGSGARTSYIDLSGDDTWGDGLRLIRDSTGTSRIVHRGTADFQIQTIEAAAMWFRTASALRGGWSAAGDWAIGNTAPQGKLHVQDGTTHAIQVMKLFPVGVNTSLYSGTVPTGAFFYGAAYNIGTNIWTTNINSGGAKVGASNTIVGVSGAANTLTMNVTSGGATAIPSGTSPVSMFLIGTICIY